MFIEVDHRVMFVDLDERACPIRGLNDAIAFRPSFHRVYQRGSRRPPPRLPPNPPPPPPNPPSGLGLASLTVRLRPPIWNWLNSVAAFCASSSVAISTNANPRARPVAASRITRTASTFPALLNSSCNSASPVVYGRFPTYSLRPIPSPSIYSGPVPRTVVARRLGSEAEERTSRNLRLDRLTARAKQAG